MNNLPDHTAEFIMTDDTIDTTDEQTELTNADVDEEDGPVDQEDGLGIEYEPGRKEPLDHGVKIRAKVKRGTGTRDQDELLLEGRGENAKEAGEDFEDSLKMAEERNWNDRLRKLQPNAQTGDN